MNRHRGNPYLLVRSIWSILDLYFILYDINSYLVDIYYIYYLYIDYKSVNWTLLFEVPFYEHVGGIVSYYFDCIVNLE